MLCVFVVHLYTLMFFFLLCVFYFVVVVVVACTNTCNNGTASSICGTDDQKCASCNPGFFLFGGAADADGTTCVGFSKHSNNIYYYYYSYYYYYFVY